MKEVIEKVLSSKSHRDSVALAAYVAQAMNVGAPWSDK